MVPQLAQNKEESSDLISLQPVLLYYYIEVNYFSGKTRSVKTPVCFQSNLKTQKCIYTFLLIPIDEKYHFILLWYCSAHALPGVKQHILLYSNNVTMKMLWASFYCSYLHSLCLPSVVPLIFSMRSTQATKAPARLPCWVWWSRVGISLISSSPICHHFPSKFCM